MSDFLDTFGKWITKLIEETESMSYEEKHEWYRLLPIMSHEHVQRLITILEEEKKKLEAFDQKFSTNENDNHERNTQLDTDE